MNFLHILPISFFRWCEAVWPGDWIKSATWVFAVVETVHIMVLAVLLGTIFVIDLRLLGVGMKSRSAVTLARELSPWTLTSIVLMVITGTMMFMSEAVKMSQSGPFFYKILFFLLALIVHFTLTRASTRPGVQEGATLGKVSACLSLFFWFAVAFGGRAIAFL
jgi:hypothetical protein